LFSFDATSSGLSPRGLTQGSDEAFYVTTWGAQVQPPTGKFTDHGSINRIVVPGADSPRIVAAVASDADFTLTLLALRTRSYQLQFTDDVTQTNWTDLGDFITATNTLVTATQSRLGFERRIYRVKLLP